VDSLSPDERFRYTECDIMEVRGVGISDQTAAIERALRASHLFAGLDGCVTTFAQAAIRRRFEHGEYIWHHGDPALALTIIVTGLVKICQPTREGESAIVAIFGPRESIGDIAVIGPGRYPADAIVVTREVEVLSIDKSPVLEAMQRDVTVAQAVNRSLVSHSQALRQKIRIMTAGPVERRLAALLAHLAERFGDEVEPGVWTIPVVLSRDELGRLIGATIETTIRVMSRWQKEGVVSTTSEGFTIHQPDKLGVT